MLFGGVCVCHGRTLCFFGSVVNGLAFWIYMAIISILMTTLLVIADHNPMFRESLRDDVVAAGHQCQFLNGDGVKGGVDVAYFDVALLGVKAFSPVDSVAHAVRVAVESNAGKLFVYAPNISSKDRNEITDLAEGIDVCIIDTSKRDVRKSVFEAMGMAEVPATI